MCTDLSLSVQRFVKRWESYLYNYIDSVKKPRKCKNYYVEISNRDRRNRWFICEICVLFYVYSLFLSNLFVKDHEKPLYNYPFEAMWISSIIALYERHIDAQRMAHKWLKAWDLVQEGSWIWRQRALFIVAVINPKFSCHSVFCPPFLFT